MWVAATVLLAAWAGVRLARLAVRFEQSRLGALAAFFLFFALTNALLLVETLLLTTGPAVRAREDLGVFVPLFWVRHAAFFIALAAAVAALGVPGGRKDREQGSSQAGAAVPFFLLVHPVLLIVQGAALFYLVLRAAWNHVQRSDPGSLRVALGFAFVLAGHLLPFVVEPEGPAPLGITGGWASLLVFVGTGVLFWATFGGRVRRGGEGGG